MDQQSNASHASFGNLKIDPHKLDMLDARISGEGGVESSFEELSKLSSYTPPRSAMSEFNDDSKSNKPLVSFENDGEVSQASCQTVHAGNLKSKTKDNHEDETPKQKIDHSGITPPSSKKKRTPSKRPASAIGDRQSTKKIAGSTESEIQSKKLKTKTKSSEDAKKCDGSTGVSTTTSESTTVTAGEQQQHHSVEAPKSESRDMHYYFGTHSNPSRSQPLPLSSPPALHSKKEQKIANQKTLHSFLGISAKKNVDKEKKGKEESSTDTGASKVGAGKQVNDVSATSSSISKQAPQVNTLSSRSKKKKQSSTNKEDASSELTTLQLENKRLLTKIEELTKQLEDANARNNSIKNNQTMISTNLQRQLKSLKSELESVRSETNAKTTKAMDVIEQLVREESIREAKDLRQKLASDGARLGRLVSSRVGLRSHDHWEDGHDPLVVKHRKAELKMKREALERRMQELTKAQANDSGFKSPDRSADTMLGSEASNSNSHADLALMNDFDRFEANETIRMHLDEVRREEAKLNEKERALQIEKQAHVRALKRVASEDSSKFRQKYKLDDRYVLMNLLGKGGFSEVWRAFDLIEMQHVAVKIHQLESSWSDAKKENYTKHVSREYEIHRDVRHPRIVSLHSVFEIDTDSFATVLECCKGTDLDTMLKDRGRLPERDARAILLQILSGMKYLSSPSADGRRQGIIHYDLKPGNILFDEQGNAKITDFGLSKIVDTADAGDSMELTSQGAGTYWYLPPECFLIDQDVRISNKVDVWSIGVIYFQMLFGRRPFGDGQSQDHILRNQTMLNATEVNFPSKPAISEGAKAFICNSLEYDQHVRPNMSKLCEHSYLRSPL
eukprot:scaffold484_cov148-Skeletonema_menzelii.AAC.12